MMHKIKDVKPMGNMMLDVIFTTGEERQYDVRPLLEKFDAFKTLIYVNGLFEQVQVDCGGYGIAWNDDIDLDCEDLWYDSIPLTR
ncbi:MAG: DUF2442 domain-containing protein [Spirochaetaceae bacterium]|jgi:hypothetical protein|nr:DUF2442 domain-containing protein [Spirochaetaceae bacterium]